LIPFSLSRASQQQHSKIHERILARTRNVPEEYRERARINVAKAEARKLGMHA
jgi:hypothetical protein